MAGFNSYSNYRNSTKELFTTYDDVFAYLTHKGNTFKRAIPLYKLGSAGNDSNILGNFSWNSSVISLLGDLDFTKVTDGGFGIVETTGSAGILNLFAGHTLPASFKCRLVDVTDASELFNNVSATCTNNTLTIPDTTGVDAGDLIYALNRSEFTIGNSTRNIQLSADNVLNFTGTSLYVKGSSLLNFIPVYNGKLSIRAEILAGYSLPNDADFVMVGWKKAANYILGGVYRYPTDHLEYSGCNYTGTFNVGNAVRNSGASNQVRQIWCITGAYLMAGVAAASWRLTFYNSCDHTNTAAGKILNTQDVINLVLGATACLDSNKGAEYSSVRVF